MAPDRILSSRVLRRIHRCTEERWPAWTYPRSGGAPAPGRAHRRLLLPAVALVGVAALGLTAEGGGDQDLLVLGALGPAPAADVRGSGHGGPGGVNSTRGGPNRPRPVSATPARAASPRSHSTPTRRRTQEPASPDPGPESPTPPPAPSPDPPPTTRRPPPQPAPSAAPGTTGRRRRRPGPCCRRPARSGRARPSRTARAHPGAGSPSPPATSCSDRSTGTSRAGRPAASHRHQHRLGQRADPAELHPPARAHRRRHPRLLPGRWRELQLRRVAGPRRERGSAPRSRCASTATPGSSCRSTAASGSETTTADRSTVSDDEGFAVLFPPGPPAADLSCTPRGLLRRHRRQRGARRPAGQPRPGRRRRRRRGDPARKG